MVIPQMTATGTSGHGGHRREQAIRAAEDRGVDGLRHACARRRQVRCDPCRAHREGGSYVADRSIVTDDVAEIRARLGQWIADPAIDVIITTGGTGFTGRDVTPEAVEPLFEKRMDGFATMFLMVSAQKIGTSAIQTRATAGVAGATYIFCLPGSPGRLPGCLGRDPRASTRLPLSPLQFRRDHAAPRRASAPRQGEGRDGVSGDCLVVGPDECGHRRAAA